MSNPDKCESDLTDPVLVEKVARAIHDAGFPPAARDETWEDVVWRDCATGQALAALSVIENELGLVSVEWRERALTAEVVAEAAVSEIERLKDALEFYASNRNWHWNGKEWVWNEPGSGRFTGCVMKHETHLPDQDAVDREPGYRARLALKENSNELASASLGKDQGQSEASREENSNAVL